MNNTDIPDINSVKHHYAGVFLVTESGEVIGQLRDDKPSIDNPGRVATFGGQVEDEDQSPLHGALRELTEEVSLVFDPLEIFTLSEYVAWRPKTKEWQVLHFFYLNIADDDLSSMEVFEGQGWTVITGPNDSRLAEGWKSAAATLFDKLGL